MIAGIAGCVGLLTSPTLPAADVEASDEGYVLSWADEFEAHGRPSPENWSYETGFRRNQELQWYQPENAFCENGLLVIEGRRERVEVDRSELGAGVPEWASWRKHAEYTSASLRTRGKHEWKYGRFVMRARVPAVAGAWPAYWTLGNGRWPSCGEIDIMEYYDQSVLANVAWSRKRGGVAWDASKTPIASLGDPSWADEFHIWRMDWNAESIKLYLDDRLMNEVPVSKADGDADPADNPFRKPHYLLVNLAIGGRHGGDPSSTAFPIRYEIDYVRVYQRSPDRDRAEDSASGPVARKTR